MPADPADPGESSGCDVPSPPMRPAHLSAGNIGLVAAGGAVGTGLRFALSLLVPKPFGLPAGIFVANILGAFALGLLLEFLADTGLDAGWSRRTRLAVGTGMLGGFTTFSALANDTLTLAESHPALATAYGLATVVAGAVASLAGIALARHRLRPALTSRTRRP